MTYAPDSHVYNGNIALKCAHIYVQAPESTKRYTRSILSKTQKICHELALAYCFYKFRIAFQRRLCILLIIRSYTTLNSRSFCGSMKGKGLTL
jgi:hypothetical protein